MPGLVLASFCSVGLRLQNYWAYRRCYKRMIDLEIPIGKRTLKYRLFEMLPATLSYGAFVLLVVLSLTSPTLAAVYLLLVIVTLLVKAFGIAIHMILGHKKLEAAQKVDWHARLADLETPRSAYRILRRRHLDEFGAMAHVDNLRLITAAPDLFPKPSQTSGQQPRSCRESVFVFSS